MGDLTLDERLKRDGARWRYIHYLESELEKRTTRQLFIRTSAALNVFLLALVAYLLV